MTAMGKSKKVVSQDKQASTNKTSFKAKKEFKPIGKRGRIVVRNLPFKCSEDDVEKHFQCFGQIKEIQLLRRPNHSLVGVGFVEFKSRQDADKAVENLNGKPFLGRTIYLEKAVARDSYDETEKNRIVKREKGKSLSEEDSSSEEDEVKQEIASSVKEDEESSSDERLFNESEIKQEDGDSLDQIKPSISKTNKVKQESGKQTNKREKRPKKARLIIRNLSFKTTEEKLRAHFSRFGVIEEVTLLRKSDKTLVGCGFVQFERKQAAAKAIFHTSGKAFLGRPIIVDWALPKDAFKKNQSSNPDNIKIEEVSDEEVSVKDEKIHVKEEKTEAEDSENESEDESEQSRNEDSDEDEDEDDSDEEEKFEKEEVKQRRKSDIDEGLTVFVKNLPFTVDNEEFKECMEQFGPVFYALVCKDKFTEHSKGSGFVKFKEKEDVEKCLSSGTELTLKGNILDPQPALKQSDIDKKKNKNESKDNRNLYLVKEGVIYAGTPAARGVSASDMQRRLELEQKKTAKLKNLNMVVSRERLVVHNLPPSYTDKQLRKLFQSYSKGKAFIKEARVMRNLNNPDGRGIGESRGFGFVTFSKHEDALNALRKINNNPDIFTASKRPIVSFSVDSLTVLNKKRKQLERSRQRNPLCKDYKPNEPPAKKAKVSQPPNAKKPRAENGAEPEFAGELARPGQKVRMRKRHKLREQAQQHAQDVRKEKREMKAGRGARRAQHLKLKQVEKKSKKKKKTSASNDSAFENLVNKYKTKLQTEKGEKKWYES